MKKKVLFFALQMLSVIQFQIITALK